ncbi:SLC13 family permease [Herbidospora sp. NBRC 101105]|uniref:SLC13 family permease n=1 Tax=Herbidospora sp. NBRC 101105 TaxID=3032195 RepID=UPI002556D1BC|nr:SLC13 family permease [Herbidospora sp. NBRC 101105]
MIFSTVGDKGSPSVPLWKRAVRAPSVLDWIRIGLLFIGVGCVLTGLLPIAEARASVERIAPLMLFLVSVIVLAELTKEAQVFDVIAARLALLGRGAYPALFLLCVAFASATTIFLNLDTTAVLLTPVMLALAPRAKIAPLPLAMTTVWLANTASLLLPVSNLTNLLALNKLGLSAPEFAVRMWLAQTVAIAGTMALLWVFYWRRGVRGADRYEPAPPEPIRDPVLFWGTGAACLLFIAAILAGLQIEVAAIVAAALAVAAYLLRDRRSLRPSLIPWQLLVFVTGLFLVVPTLMRHGLGDLMTWLVGTGEGFAGLLRTAAAGAGLSNTINNLPAYVAGEQVVPAADLDQLLALLAGTNVGSVITPWASLATLLWFEWCRRRGVRVPLGKFVLTGAVLAILLLPSVVWVLALT